MSKNSKQNNTTDKKIKKLIPMVQKYFPNADMIEATEILNEQTNLKDTFLEIEQQIQLYKKQLKKGEV